MLPPHNKLLTRQEWRWTAPTWEFWARHETNTQIFSRSPERNEKASSRQRRTTEHRDSPVIQEPVSLQQTLRSHRRSSGPSVNLLFQAGVKWLKTRQLSQMKMDEVAPKRFKGRQESSAMVWGQKNIWNKFTEDEFNPVLTLLDSKSFELKYSTSAPPSSGPNNSVEGRP